jgi:hypothetical protein
MAETKKMKLGAWMDELAKATAGRGKACRFETKDGGIRSGRLTGLRMQEIRLNGRRCDLITQIELNGDKTDAVPFFNIKELEIFDD